MPKNNILRKVPEYIEIMLDDQKKMVASKAYVTAKTRDLREFGYTTLKEEEVEKAILNCFNGTAVTVIDFLVQGDLVLPE